MEAFGAAGSRAQGFPEMGERLRAARAAAGATRKELAAASGTSERYIAHVEAGTANPSVAVLTALASALVVPVAELLPLGGERDQRTAEAVAAVRRLNGRRLGLLIDQLRASSAVDRASRIVLLGMRGAGKSSMGQALARRLGCPFVELTRVVEDSFGGELRLLMELEGRAGLRHHQSVAWERLVETHERLVVAAPGGVVADVTLYDRMLDTAHSVWLMADPEDHMARVVAQGDLRPMSGDRRAMTNLRAILRARSAEYARAQVHVDTSRQDPQATLDLLERRLERLCAGAGSTG
ncbi:shikimate kinase [Pseudonocardia sp. CA-107938]|uniref:shikimate kinase n=1 Tax=Pseudonocardia sp. CA-107938 TaxID=3240021 RepID=UPI003D913AE7